MGVGKHLPWAGAHFIVDPHSLHTEHEVDTECTLAKKINITRLQKPGFKIEIILVANAPEV